MGQMASLLSTLCRRLPQTPDGCPPEKNRQPSGTGVSSETQHSVESNSNESTSDEGDRSVKRKSSTRMDDYMSVHASGDERVDVKLLGEPQSQQVTNQQKVDNAVLKELSYLLALQSKKTDNGPREEMIQRLEGIRKNVSSFPKFIPLLVAYLRSLCQCFHGVRSLITGMNGLS